VQLLPPSSEAADREGVRRHREHEHDQPRAHADRDERALEDVLSHPRPVEVFVDERPHEQMRGAVEEREETEHAPQLDHLVPAGEAAQRRDAERDLRFSASGRKCPLSSDQRPKHTAYASQCMFSRLERDVVRLKVVGAFAALGWRSQNVQYHGVMCANVVNILVNMCYTWRHRGRAGGNGL
jgi:hypothetical protein